METLIKFLTDKIGYTALIILGFLFPGIMFIFIWNRQIFMEMEWIKLVLLALSISFMIFIANFLCTTICFAIQNRIGIARDDIVTLLGFPVFVANAEMIFAMMYKIDNPNFTIVQFIDIVVTFLSVLFLVGFVPSIVILAKQKIGTKIHND